MTLIDVDGQRHKSTSSSPKLYGDSSSPTPWGRFKRYHTFRVPLTRVAGFEYRVRAYSHWVTFENVSLNPSEITDVKVSTAENAAVKLSERLRFTTPIRIDLPRLAAQGGRWFFVDLDHGKLVKPPFVVELDRKRLPFNVLQPDEEQLKKWLVENGVDLILFAEPRAQGAMSEVVQTWSIRTNLRRLNELIGKEEAEDRDWIWNDSPELVLKPFARHDEVIHVSGFVPSSNGGIDVMPHRPDVQAFRTANNVVGFYLLEYNELNKDSLRLRIIPLAGVKAPLADIKFDGDVLSGKFGAADPPHVVKPFKADLPE